MGAGPLGPPSLQSDAMTPGHFTLAGIVFATGVAISVVGMGVFSLALFLGMAPAGPSRTLPARRPVLGRGQAR